MISLQLTHSGDSKSNTQRSGEMLTLLDNLGMILIAACLLSPLRPPEVTIVGLTGLPVLSFCSPMFLLADSPCIDQPPHSAHQPPSSHYAGAKPRKEIGCCQIVVSGGPNVKDLFCYTSGQTRQGIRMLPFLFASTSYPDLLANSSTPSQPRKELGYCRFCFPAGAIPLNPRPVTALLIGSPLKR